MVRFEVGSDKEAFRACGRRFWWRRDLMAVKVVGIFLAVSFFIHDLVLAGVWDLSFVD